MFSWIGFRQCGVPYDRPARYAGATNYSWRRLIQLAIDGIVSFTDVPLRLALTLGFLMSVGSFITGIFAIAAKLADFFAVPGWASIVMVTSFTGGVLLFVVGMVGLYVGRIYEEVKARPLYIVDNTLGFEGRTTTRSSLRRRH
jgi:dolichol-phosphate mannosyltransferase